MFDVSFSEIAIIGVVLIALFGPKEAVEILMDIKRYFNSAKSSLAQYMEYIESECSLGKNNEPYNSDKIMGYIVDLDGNLQPTYDLSCLTPEIKSSDSNTKKPNGIWKKTTQSKIRRRSNKKLLHFNDIL